MVKIPKLPEGLQKALAKAPLIVGIGPSAWPRVISGYYFPKFKILCYSDCQDNEYIRNSGIDVYSLKQIDPYLEVAPVTPGKIIQTGLAKNFLDNLREPFTFLVYKSIGSFERVCRENHWSFLGNIKEIRDKYEDKRIFKQILREIRIEAIPGENIPIGDMTSEKFSYFQAKLGQKKLVLQIAEATWGGGSGTLFLDRPEQVKEFHERVAELREALEGKKKLMETVNVAPYIEGISASIPCCTTKYGVFTGSIQTQIVDVEEVGARLKNRSGVFAGHDWGFSRFSKNSQLEADRLGQRFGDHLYKNGYRGIFGLDIIVTKTGRVWPVECNPRETDAFPLVCMLQMEKGVVPMQVFHNLEHLGIDYNVDFDEINEGYKNDYSASQIILYSMQDTYTLDRGVLKAGVYRVREGKLEFVREGFAVWDLKDDGEFLLTEDIAKIPGTVYAPHERMLRIIKKGGILEKENKLRDDAGQTIDLIYRAMKLIPIDHGFIDRGGLGVLYANKIIEARKEARIVKADIVNVIRDTGSGFYRPLEISWRKKIESRPILGQIRSRKAQKQITSDIAKIGKLGIEIKTLPELNRDTFNKWHDLYESIIGAKAKGHVVIGKDWFDKKQESHKKVGAVVALRGGKVIGGDIFFDVNGVLGVGYGVAERVSGLLGSLGMLLDYYFLEYAQGAGYKEVSFGQDTNLYGFDLSCGLVAYKTKLGFYPVAANKTYWVSTYFLNLDKFGDPAMFFSGDKDKLKLTVITDKKAEIDANMYLPDGLKFDNYHQRSKILSEHRKMFITNE